MQKTTIIDHVERLRAKPEHVRMRIALGTTFGITGLVAVLWVSTLTFSGKLALNPFNAPDPANPYATSASGDSQVAGVGSSFVVKNAAPTLTVVGAASSTPAAPKAPVQDTTGGSQTVIPF